MSMRTFSRGQPVVYRKSKCSSRPGRRAVRVVPSPRGEDYAYQVDKYWIVAEQRDDETVVLATRRGKVHLVRCDDPNLRHATLWERFRYGYRFPSTRLLGVERWDDVVAPAEPVAPQPYRRPMRAR